MVEPKILTIVVTEDTDGQKYISYYGNMPIVEAMAYCQNALLNEEKKKAVEEYKKGLESDNRV